MQSGINNHIFLLDCGLWVPLSSQQCYKKALILPCELLFTTFKKPVEKNSCNVDMLMDHLELDRELTKTKERTLQILQSYGKRFITSWT
jgi:hypothetical protein